MSQLPFISWFTAPCDLQYQTGTSKLGTHGQSPDQIVDSFLGMKPADGQQIAFVGTVCNLRQLEEVRYLHDMRGGAENRTDIFRFSVTGRMKYRIFRSEVLDGPKHRPFLPTRVSQRRRV